MKDINEKIEQYLNEKKNGYSNEDVAEFISNYDSLSHAIVNLSYKDIEDPKLAREWKNTDDSIRRIFYMLKQYDYMDHVN
jgi:hypothetical protein